jgi:hypothetical protein
MIIIYILKNTNLKEPHPEVKNGHIWPHCCLASGISSVPADIKRRERERERERYIYLGIISILLLLLPTAHAAADG